jgi:hypothetical protein
MMPIKFKPSSRTLLKGTNKYNTEHFYMKSTPTAELQSALESSNTPPKRKQKIKNELVKRGI